MSDETLDQPADDDAMELVMPFLVVASHGGPYDDDAFAAGWQAGEIDRTLRTAAAIAATVVEFPIVHAGLVPQLDLIGMKHGYKVTAEPTADGWVAVTFEVSR